MMSYEGSVKRKKGKTAKDDFVMRMEKRMEKRMRGMEGRKQKMRKEKKWIVTVSSVER